MFSYEGMDSGNFEVLVRVRSKPRQIAVCYRESDAKDIVEALTYAYSCEIFRFGRV